MTIEELIKKLQEIIEVDPELAQTEVHMATQPNYPLVTQLSHVKLQSKNAAEIADLEKELTVDLRSQTELEGYIEQLERDEEHTLVMVEGDWVGYGSRKLWDHED